MVNRPKPNPPAAKPLHWYRMDLHLHTPASADFKDRGITYLQYLQKAESRGLDIIALTDHNTVAGWAAMYAEVETLLTLDKRGRLTEEEKHSLSEYRRLAEKMMVLPGFEVTATLGFHVLGVFPQGTTVRKLEHILLDLNVPEDRLEMGVGEVGSTTDVLTVYREIAEAGGIAIAAHANSTHGVALQGFDFGGQTKIAYTQDKNLHALEVTDLESTSRRRTANFFNGSKPEYPRRMHCIQGSDAHRLEHDPRDKGEPWGIGDRVTEVYLPELSFESLKTLFLGNDFSATRPARPWGAVAPQPAFDAVKAARKQGPNLVQSFHEHIAGKPGRIAAIVADIVAMANTNGGTIYVGVNASPKPPVVGVEKPEEAIALLRKELQKATTPAIGADIDVVQTEGKSVVEIKVPKGADTPYVLGTGQIYVRQESETTLAMRDEIIRLVLAGQRPAQVPAQAPAPAVSVEATVEPAAAPKPAAVPRPQPQRPIPQRVVPRQPVTPAPAPAAVAQPTTPPPVQVQPPAAIASPAAGQPAPVVAAAPALVPAAAAARQAPVVPPQPQATTPAKRGARPAARLRRAKAAAASPEGSPAPEVTVPEAPAPVPAPAVLVEPPPAAGAVAAAPARKPARARGAKTKTPAVEVVPPPQPPPQPLPEPEAPAKPSRRRRGKAPAGPTAAAAAPEAGAAAPVTLVPDELPEATATALEAPDAVPPESTAVLYAEPPRTGVEIMSVENRDGVLTYTVRDLRNNNVVHNVTRFSARHLWKYAIAEREDHPCTEGDLTWQGRLGLWKTYKRAGAERYNLVQRDSDGVIHVYYGVTEDGIHGEWRGFLTTE